MKKRVYSVCDFEGNYIELFILEEDEIVNEDYSSEEWGGYPKVTYRDLDGNEDTFHFLGVVEVN